MEASRPRSSSRPCSSRPEPIRSPTARARSSARSSGWRRGSRPARAARVARASPTSPSAGKLAPNDYFPENFSGKWPRTYDGLLNFWAADYPDPAADLVTPFGSKFSNVEGWQNAAYTKLTNQYMNSAPEFVRPMMAQLPPTPLAVLSSFSAAMTSVFPVSLNTRDWPNPVENPLKFGLTMFTSRH